MNSVLKFILSVIVFPLIIYVAYVKIVGGAVDSVIHDMAADQQRRATAISDRSKERQEMSGRQAAAETKRRLEVAASATQAAANAARTEQAAAARKETAWRAYFKPRRVCDNPPDWDTQVECGNAYIRTKREFDSRWDRGDLQ